MSRRAPGRKGTRRARGDGNGHRLTWRQIGRFWEIAERRRADSLRALAQVIQVADEDEHADPCDRRVDEKTGRLHEFLQEAHADSVV